MDDRINWSKFLGLDDAAIARLGAGLALPAGFDAANIGQMAALTPSSFNSIADNLAQQRAAMVGSIASGMSSLDAVLAQQQNIARLAAEAITPFPSGTVKRLAAGLSAVSFGVSEITRITAAFGPDSLAAQQGELLAESYGSFSSDLLGNQPERMLGGSEAAIAAFGTGAAAAAFLEGTEVLGDIARAEGVGVARAVLVRPNIYDAFYDVIEQRRSALAPLPHEEVDRELSDSLPWRIFRAGKRIVELRRHINQAGLRTNNSPVFRPTTETEFISFRFSQDIVNNEDDFDGFVDRMHKYMFESSDGLRTVRVYLPENPPLIADLATLRHYYSHDPESRSEKDRAASLARVGRVFTSMIGTLVPASQDQWRQSQLLLLERVVSFLETLLGEIDSATIA